MFFSKIYKKKHQTFEYTPRYWDPRREEFRKRVENAKREKEGGADGMKHRIAQGFKRAGVSERRHIKKQAFRSNMLVIMIAIILCILAYYFLQEYLPKIIEAFE